MRNEEKGMKLRNIQEIISVGLNDLIIRVLGQGGLMISLLESEEDQ